MPSAIHETLLQLAQTSIEGGRNGSSPLTIVAAVADETFVAQGTALGGRPHHRIGDRYQNLKDL